MLKLKDRPYKDLFFHSGYINDANSFIGFIPSADIGIIILANQASYFPLESGIKFWTKFLE